MNTNGDEDFNSMVVKDDNYMQNDTGTIIEYNQNKNTNNYNYDTMIEHKNEVNIILYSLRVKIRIKIWRIWNIIISCMEINKINKILS